MVATLTELPELVQKSQRIVITGPNELAYETYDLPQTPEANQIIVKNENSMISAGTELALFTGSHQNFSDPTATWPRYPLGPGYNSIARVVKCGTDVKSVSAGDRIVNRAHHQPWDILAEPEEGFWRLPDTLSNDQALFLVMAGISNVASELSRFNEETKVAIIGLGLIGNLCGQIFKMKGAQAVAGLDLSEFRREKAKQCGYDLLIDPTKEDVASVFEKQFGGAPDIIVEAIGLSQTIEQAIKWAPSYGQVVLLGSPRKPQTIDVYRDVHVKGLNLIGSHARNTYLTVDEQFAFCAQGIESGKIKTNELITDRLGFEDVNGAYSTLIKESADHLAMIIDY